MNRYFWGTLAAGLLMIAMMFASEPPAPPERTFRASCQHPSHGRPVWLASAYLSFGPALMEAHKHNEANAGHEAIVVRLRGGRR